MYVDEVLKCVIEMKAFQHQALLLLVLFLVLFVEVGI